MVKRKVKLAQVVCAVYSLNKPSGVTKREIIKFCRNRYGCNCPTKDFNIVIERALDEGLLASFHSRFVVTKLRHGILWIGDTGVEPARKRAAKGKKKRNTGVIYNRKRVATRNYERFQRGKVILEDRFKNNSTLYKVWKKELKRQLAAMKNKGRKESKCRKILGEKVNGSKLKSGILKKRGNTKKVKIGKRNNLKRNTNIKQSRQSMKTGDKKRSNKHSSSRESRESENQRERYRSLFRQTKYAVVHGKSWDRLNESRQEKIRENQEMVKNSQLVQKILTQKHAASWDDLNSKLKTMKKASCSPQEERANGDGVPQLGASASVASL